MIETDAFLLGSLEELKKCPDNQATAQCLDRLADDLQSAAASIDGDDEFAFAMRSKAALVAEIYRQRAANSGSRR